MERIVIMVRDEVGVLSDITRVLAEANINLETINTQVNGEQGNVIISTDDTDRALHVLTDAGYTAVTDDALLIRLKDEDGCAGPSGPAVQRGRHKHSEPTHSGPDGWLRHHCLVHRPCRPGQGGSAGGPGFDSITGLSPQEGSPCPHGAATTILGILYS